MDRQTDGHKAISWHCFAEGGFYYLNIIQKNDNKQKLNR